MPLVWSPTTSEARDLNLLPSRADGVPRSVDGTTAVGNCCFGEEGTPLPLLWDLTTGAVQQLDLPAQFPYGRAVGVSGTVAIGSAEAAAVIWDLATGQPSIVPAPEGYESIGLHAVSDRTIVGSACEPPPTSADNPRCGPAAWALP